MSRNTALVTDAAQASAQSDLDDYAAGVAAHIGSDWAGHRQVNVANTNFSTAAGILSTKVVRMLADDDLGAQYAIITPCFYVADAAADDAPVIVVQPVNVTASVGGTASFFVYAASATEMSYQWQFKDDTDTSWNVIPDATSVAFVITDLVKANAGSYRVIITNAVGSISSAIAILTVS